MATTEELKVLINSGNANPGTTSQYIDSKRNDELNALNNVNDNRKNSGLAPLSYEQYYGITQPTGAPTVGIGAATLNSSSSQNTNDNPLVILRNIVEGAGKKIDWDANSKNVIINGTQYTPEQLKSMGGVLEDGRWKIDKNTANQLAGVQNVPVQTEDPLKAIMDAITAANQGYLQTQIAGAASNRDAQLAELQASLNKAIQDGQMSVLEAREAFEKQSQAINAQAYQDSEQTQVQMQSMGVQNSQQGIGMIASDQSRKQSLVNDNIKNRDNRILQINERIKGLTSDAEIQRNRINADYDTAVLNAQGQSAYNTSNAMADLQSKNYFSDKEQEFQKFLQDDQQTFTSTENQTQREFETAEAKADREWKSTEADLARKHDITMQGNEFKHDERMTGIKFANELTAMAKQAGYATQLENLRSSNAMAEYEAKINKEYEMILKEQNNKLISEYKKYNDPNSLEAKTFKGQLAAETQQRLDGVLQETLAGSMVDLILNRPASFEKANVDEFIDNMGGWDKFLAMDEISRNTYDKTLKAIDSGVSKEQLIKSLNIYPKSAGEEIIKTIVEPMYANKEWDDVYAELKKMMESGMLNQ